MSKRQRPESHENDPETKFCKTKSKNLVPGQVPCSRSAKQRFLYVVLDDWEKGYSVHRVNQDDFGSDASLDARPLKCPLVRIQAEHAYTCSFAAHGTKILAMQPARSSPGIPVFDTETLEMTVYPYPKSRSVIMGRLVYTSVGDRLVSFVFRCLEVLGPEPPRTEGSWSWSSSEQPTPFMSGDVSGYALHPDGRTIFVSVKDWHVKTFDTRNSTFSIDGETLEWTHLGNWLLPFKGRAHYDRELDAWVGICLFEEGAGHLCCCDAPPVAGCSTMPAWKFCKEAFFDERSGWHVGATLVYMGDSRFCLFESRDVDDGVDQDQRLRVLLMTSFGLKYDRVGELVTTQYKAYSSVSYRTAHTNLNLCLNPVAFWM